MLTVVITRPEPDHLRLLEMLASHSCEVLHVPAFGLAPNALNDADLRKLEQVYDRVIVISPMAARLVVQDHAQARGLASMFITPGAGSARILEGLERPVLYPQHGATSEAMLALPALAEIEGRSVLILTAPGGRTLLNETLKLRGAHVDELQLYRRIPLTLSNQQIEGLSATLPSPHRRVTLMSSQAAFEHLLSQLNDEQALRWLQGDFVVSSTRLRDRLQARGARRLLVAASPSDEAMRTALGSFEMDCDRNVH
ncbi:MAG: uroporphyrinogen-III synthase [Pseudomonadota bacterium]